MPAGKITHISKKVLQSIMQIFKKYNNFKSSIRKTGFLFIVTGISSIRQLLLLN